MNLVLIAIIGVVIILFLPVIPGIIQTFVVSGTQLYELNERTNLKEVVGDSIESVLDASESWCSLMYDELFEILEEQINDNPRIKTAKVIYDKVGYLDGCRVDELMSYLDSEQRKRFDRMEIMCNLSSCTKVVYSQFQGNQ